MTGQGARDGSGPRNDTDPDGADPLAQSRAHGPLLTLTGTELEVLEAAHLVGLAGHRPVDADEDGVGEAWVEAIRSLGARGLLGADGGLSQDNAVGMLVRTLLDVRLGAAAVVVVERLLGAPDERRDLRLLHLLPLGAVVEDLHEEGWHGFDLVLDPDLLVAAVVEMLVPPDAAPGTGGPQLVDPGQPGQMAGQLGHPTVLAELTLVVPEGQAPEQSHLVAMGPGGCFEAVRDGHGPALRFGPVDPGWVEATTQRWVSGTMSR